MARRQVLLLCSLLLLLVLLQEVTSQVTSTATTSTPSPTPSTCTCQALDNVAEDLAQFIWQSYYNCIIGSCDEVDCNNDDGNEMSLMLMQCSEPPALRVVYTGDEQLDHTFNHSEVIPYPGSDNQINVTFLYSTTENTIGLQVDLIVPGSNVTQTLVPYTVIPLDSSGCTTPTPTIPATPSPPVPATPSPTPCTCQALDSVAEDLARSIWQSYMYNCIIGSCDEVDCNNDDGKEISLMLMQCSEPPALRVVYTNSTGDEQLDHTFSHSEVIPYPGNDNQINVTFLYSTTENTIGLQVDLIVSGSNVTRTLVPYTVIPLDSSGCTTPTPTIPATPSPPVPATSTPTMSMSTATIPTATTSTPTATIPTATTSTSTMSTSTATIPTSTSTSTMSTPTATIPTSTSTMPTPTATIPTSTSTSTMSTSTMSTSTSTMSTSTMSTSTATIPTSTSTSTMSTSTMPTPTATIPTSTMPTPTATIPTSTMPTPTATIPTATTSTSTIPTSTAITSTSTSTMSTSTSTMPATPTPPMPATSTPPVPATPSPPVPATSTPPVPATSTPPVPATSTPTMPATPSPTPSTCQALDSVAEDLAQFIWQSYTCIYTDFCDEVDCSDDDGDKMSLMLMQCSEPPALRVVYTGDEQLDHTFSHSEVIPYPGNDNQINVTFLYSTAENTIGLQVDLIVPGSNDTLTMVPYTVIPLDSSGCHPSSSGGSKIPLIIGTSVGGVMLVLVVVIVVVVTILLCRRCRRKGQYQFLPLDDLDSKDKEEDD